MSLRFEEIDWRPTPLGDISLRRRRLPAADGGERDHVPGGTAASTAGGTTEGAVGAAGQGTGDRAHDHDSARDRDVYEVKLGDEFLMSSLFTAGEIALARLGLAAATAGGGALDVVVGGLGLGYTARAALDDPRVRSLVVVEALGEVIDWHRRGLVPLGEGLTGDPRCRLVHGDFFALAADPGGLDPEEPGRRFDAVLLDIDHSPRHVLHPRNAGFYQPAGLRALAARLRPGGVFALWSDDPPDEPFTAVLAEVFADPAAHVVEFDNPVRGGTSANTVYVATTRADVPAAS